MMGGGLALDLAKRGMQMAIFLKQTHIENLASMEMALEAVEEAFRLQGEEKADNAPRRRCRLRSGLLHVMSASLPTLGFAGLKSYTSSGGTARRQPSLVRMRMRRIAARSLVFYAKR